MQKLLMILILAAAAMAAGDCDTPDGPQPYQAPPPVYTDSDQIPGIEGYASPVIHSSHRPPEGPATWEEDWGWDVLVHDTRVGSNQDIALDEDTGDLYAIFDTNHSTMDSVIVCRSQDGGATWNLWVVSYNPGGSVDNPMIEIVKDTSGQEWVCMFFVASDGLWMRRMTPAQTGAVYEKIADNVVEDYDVAGEAGTAGWVYVTYVPEGTTNIGAARNHLAGGGWINNYQLYTATQVDPYPTIACATGGVVSVAFSDTRWTGNNEIRQRRSVDYGSSWSGSEQISNNSSGADLTWTDMAYTHNSSTTAAGWIFTTFEFSNYDNLGYYYTTNAGQSWNYGDVMYPYDADQNMPDLCAYRNSPTVTLAYNSDPGDSTMFSWTAGTNPTNWTTPVRINDHQATGYWPPSVVSSFYPAVLYTSWTQDYNCFFDWGANTSVEEENSLSLPGWEVSVTMNPNPFTDFTSISVTSLQPGNASLSIYDSAGRLIDTPVNQFLESGTHSIGWTAGENLSPGVYFCVLTYGGQQYSQRMVLVR